MIKTVIIDDEERTRTTISLLLAEFSQSFVIVGQAGSVQTGFDLINETKPDLVFLDVEMPDGTGFNLISRFAEIDFEVIFVTGHSNYAIKAIKIDALDYILKPVQPYELFDALKKSEQKILSKHAITSHVSTSITQVINPTGKPKKITLKTAESINIVDVDDIVRCEADGPYTCFYFKDQKKLMVSKTLKEFDSLLEPYGFIRVHQSHLVNATYIIRYDRINGGGLILKDNSFVPVSIRKRDEVLQFLDKLSR